MDGVFGLAQVYGGYRIWGNGSFSSQSESICPTDDYRYITTGSKWIVLFINGDLTNPVIISRYYVAETTDEDSKD